MYLCRREGEERREGGFVPRNIRSNRESLAAGLILASSSAEEGEGGREGKEDSKATLP